MPDLKFAPGELDVKDAAFSPSVVLFWLKTKVGVSSTRIMTTSPNTILGVFPLGYVDATQSLRNVASVGVNARFSIGRLIGGLVFLIAAVSLFGKSPVAGFIVLVIAVSLLANVMSAALQITNNGGGVSQVHVSIFEKGKLEQFREEINQRLFADHERLRHAEHMSVQNQQLYTQQQQLSAQILNQNAQLQQQVRQEGA